jgi:hypothetical protein
MKGAKHCAHRCPLACRQATTIPALLWPQIRDKQCYKWGSEIADAASTLADVYAGMGYRDRALGLRRRALGIARHNACNTTPLYLSTTAAVARHLMDDSDVRRWHTCHSRES